MKKGKSTTRRLRPRQYGLGNYITCYRSKHSVSGVGVGAIGLGVVFGGVSIVWMHFLLRLLLLWQFALIPSVALGWIAAGMWMLSPCLLKGKSVTLHEKGLVFTTHKGDEIIRWCEIEALWWKTGDAKHNMLLCEVQRTDGFSFAVDSTFQNAERLERILEREVIHQLFAYCVGQFRSNIPVAFGPLVLTQQGISVEPHTHILPWCELKYIDCFEDMLYIRQKQQCHDVASIPLSSIPNACVLRVLMRHIDRVHREAFIQQTLLIPKRSLRPQVSPVWQ